MTVRFVYLVSKDRSEREDYRQAIESAALDVQAWYAKQLGGWTFRLHSPIVEVVRSSRTADWFYAHPNGERKDDWGYNNAFDEGARLLGVKHYDDRYVWVIYSDGPGDKGRAGAGVACMPEEDLIGLIGRHPTQPNRKRWIGGLAHELGHALGLKHPADEARDRDAVMSWGYRSYPDRAYLTAEDKSLLLNSPFIFDASGRPAAPAAGGFTSSRRSGARPGARRRRW